MTKNFGILALLVLLGCDGPAAVVDAGGGDAGRAPDSGGADSGGADSGRADSGGVDAGDVDAGDPDAGEVVSACGAMRPSLTGITGTEGLVIARDGTIYYSQSGAVGRMRPGEAPEDDFVSVESAGGTVWGLALDAANETLFVAAPGIGVRRIDLTAETPSDAPFVDGGAPNGLTFGPDGFLYYSDFSAGRVYRVNPDNAVLRGQVTATSISGANGLAFEPAGTLLVASYSGGELVRLTLSAGGVETDRATVSDEVDSPDGVVVAADGTIFVGDQGRPGGGDPGVYRVAADGSVTPVLTGLERPASVEFGAGALDCDDLYVAVGGGPAARVEGVGPGAAVPWH